MTIRRVVTGHNSQGKSMVISDGLVPERGRFALPDGSEGASFWEVSSVPVNLSEATDPIETYVPQNPPVPGGVVGRIITWQPGFEYPMHTTQTIDFAIVISGQIELGLEEGSVILGSGDVTIQRATAHKWRVVGDEPCTIAFVLIDAKSK